MRKILSGGMVLILVVLFAATYYCSRKTEAVFKAQIEQINLNYAGLVKVDLLDYQRGLLVSKVKTSISLRDKDALPLDHQIRHFPWKVRIMTGLPEETAVIQDLIERVPLEELQLQTDVGLNGASQSRFALPELSLADANGLLQLKGLEFVCDLDQQLQGGQVQLQMNSLTFRQPGEAELAVAGVAFDSQFSEQQGLMLGGGDFEIQQLVLKPDNKPGFELKGFRYQATSELENEQLSSRAELQLAAMILAEETFTDGQLQLKVTGIDVASLREMQEMAKQFQADMIDQQVDPMILQLQLLGLYSQLFKEGLTLTLDQLSLQADEGELQGQGYLTLQDLNIAETSPASLDKLNGEFQLNIDRPAFNAGFRLLEKLRRGDSASKRAVADEQAEQLAGGLVQKGIFTRREDGGYRIDLLVEQGQGKLNGNPFRF